MYSVAVQVWMMPSAVRYCFSGRMSLPMHKSRRDFHATMIAIGIVIAV